MWTAALFAEVADSVGMVGFAVAGLFAVRGRSIDQWAFSLPSLPRHSAAASCATSSSTFGLSTGRRTRIGSGSV